MANFSLKVYYEDTDAEGIVYYANYLKYLERARTEFIYSSGLSHKDILSKYKIPPLRIISRYRKLISFSNNFIEEICFSIYCIEVLVFLATIAIGVPSFNLQVMWVCLKL